MASSSFGIDVPRAAQSWGLPRRLEGPSLWVSLFAVYMVFHFRRNYALQAILGAAIGMALFLRGTGWLLDSKYLKTYQPPQEQSEPASPP